MSFASWLLSSKQARRRRIAAHLKSSRAAKRRAFIETLEERRLLTLAVQFDATTLGLASGAIVSNWGGQSAAGTPTFLTAQTPSGRPAVEFNGSDRMGDNVPIAASAASDWIFVAVVKPTNIGSYQNLVDDDPSSRPMFWIDPSFNYEFNFAGGTGAKSAGVGTNGWDIVIADSKNNQLYVNSSTPNATGGGAVPFNADKNFDFFHRDVGQTFQGLVAEERLYTDRADFGSDFATLYNTLKSKWLVPNSLPSTPVDNDAAVNTVLEGAATGTTVGVIALASDPDGNTLTYSLTNTAGGRFAIDSSTGLVTVANGVLLDGANSQTITVQASDGSGGISSASFSIDVVNDAPTAAFNNSGPVNEGSTATVSFSGQNDPSTTDMTAGFRYAYDFNNDGTFDSGDGTYEGSIISASVTVAASYLTDGPSTRKVKGRIIDKDGGFTDYTNTITINNVAPSNIALSLNTATINEGQSVTLSVSYLDPGIQDSQSIAVNWGDGSTSTTTPNSSAIIDLSKLLALYTFEGNSQDVSGHGRNGTVSGATLTSQGYQGSAYTFNGSSDYIGVPLNINPSVLPKLTMGAWVNATSNSPVRQIISHDNGGYDRGIGIDYRGGGNPSNWSAFTGSGVLGGSPVVTNQWVFVAVVYDQAARTETLYVNGTAYSATNVQEGEGWSTLRIGSNPSYGEYFQGTIDNVFFYGDTMTAAQIASIGTSGAPALTGSGVTLSHQYFATPPVGNTYTITTTVTDKDGGSGSATTPVTVNEVPLTEPGTALPSIPSSSIFRSVPEAANYRVVYEVNIPTAANFGSTVSYAQDNSAQMSTAGFSRVAYALELNTTNNAGDNKWVWVSFDRPSNITLASKLGVPNVNSGEFYNRSNTSIANMNIYSNASGITTGSGISTGNIEFWPSNYGTGNDNGIPGANPNTYDFGDGGASTATGYGSMQIHNYGAGQTLFAFNRWGGANGNVDIGIGNQIGGSGHPDWTFAVNAGNYVVKHMYVLAYPTGAGGFTVNANGGVDSGVQTVAQFRDPGGALPNISANYAAGINWGDGSSPSIGTISYDSGTGIFSVKGQHTYANLGTFTVTTSINHGTAPTLTATSTAVVTEAPSLIVNTTADVVNALDGVTSLREAIALANSNIGGDTVKFNISGGGTQTITLATALPAISGADTVDLNNNNISLVGGVLIGSGIITNNAAGGTATLTENGTGTFSGVIKNGAFASTALTVAGGTLTLTGTNTFTGAININAGKLTFSNQLVSSTAVNIASGATLEYAIASGSMRQQNNITFTGTGTLLKSGAGEIDFGGPNGSVTWQLGGGGLIDVQGGIMVGGSNVQDFWTNNLSNLNIASGAVFSGVEANVRLDQLTGLGTLYSGYPGAGYTTFTVGVNNGSSTFAGVIANTPGLSVGGNFTKIGTGTLTLSGANTYSGGTNVNAGILTLANNSAAGTGAILVSSTTGGTGSTGTRVAMQGGITVNNALSLPSNATGNIRSALYANDANNTWSGPVTLNGNGLIHLAGNPGASLRITGGVSGPNFTGTLGGARGSNTFTTTIASTINLPSGSMYVTDNANLIVSSIGNTLPTVQIAYGTLKLGANNALPTNTNLQIGQNFPGFDFGTLDLAGFNQQVRVITNLAADFTHEVIGNSSTTADSTLTFSGSGSPAKSTYSGIIQDALGSGTRKTALTVNAGTLTLAGTSTYSGATTVNSFGTLAAGSTTALSPNSSFNVNGALTLNGINNTVGSLNGSGTVANAVSVFQIDNGAIFSGFNNSLSSAPAEDNWVGNVFTATSPASLNSISFRTNSALNATNLPSPFVTSALYMGSPATGLTLVPSSVKTVPLNAAAGQFVEVPFATPQNITVGQVFTAALLIKNVPVSVFPFQEANSGTNANSYYDISNPSGTVNAYNLASPFAPTPNGVIHPGTSGTNAGVGITVLRVNATPAVLPSAATLIVANGGNFAGTISGSNTSLALSAGTLILSGSSNSYGGTTTVTGGKLLVNGTSTGTGAINVNNSAILGGTGAVAGPVNVNNSARVVIGSNPETLGTGTVSFSGTSFFDVNIGGSSPGDGTTGYDQLIVTGGVNLANATLNLISHGYFIPTAGQSFKIIDNDGVDAVSGSFASLQDGATIPNFFGSGFPAYIRYSAGTGNDVVITVNSAPVVAVNAAAVTVNEGGNANNTGTFSDADGNGTVTITASIGNLTNDSSGQWSWSLGTADGPTGPLTVTITATDDRGVAATATFSYAIDNVSPTISLSGNATVNEGEEYTLNLGVVTDPGQDTITNYKINWGDGVIDSFVGNPANTTAKHTFADGPSSQTNTVTVTDEDGTFLTGSLDVQVLNIAPTATLIGNIAVNYGDTVSVAFSDQLDKSNPDTIAGFHYAYTTTQNSSPPDFTGITYNSGSTTNTSQVFAELLPGDYTVHGRIIDKDNAFRDYTVAVKVNYVNTFTVTNANDDGVGSLRRSIYLANHEAGSQSITFSLPASGPFKIRPLSALPTILDAVVIDGSTQPGSFRVELDGTLAGASTDGLTITSDNSTIRGLVINRFGGAGIEIAIGGNNAIVGNFIGTSFDGTQGQGNGDGVRITEEANHNTIGGSDAGAKNVISGNMNSGVYIAQAGVGNKVQGNFIGTDVSGSLAIGNASATSSSAAGVFISSMAGNRVVIGVDGDGTQDANEGNLISGNLRAGIRIEGGNSELGNHVVAGNRIGVNVGGTLVLPNQGDGIQIVSSSDNRIGTNSDGTSDDLEANIIAGNKNLGDNPDGVSVRASGISISLSSDSNQIVGNFIGTDKTGVLALGNQAAGIGIQNATNTVIGSNSATGQNLIYFSGSSGIELLGNVAEQSTIVRVNSFRANQGLAIDMSDNVANEVLVADGITLNDNGDTDSKRNFPVITSATIASGNLTLRGFLPLGQSFELYSASAEANSLFGEGQTLLATFINGTAGSESPTSGFYGPVVKGVTVSLEPVNESPFEFTIPLAAGLTNGTLLTARTTGRTSEFGPLVIAGQLASKLAPVITMPPSVALDVGGRLQASGSFVDSDSSLWTATVDYADGSGVQALTLKPDRAFDLDHVFATVGTFNVRVTITDNSLATTEGSLTVTVSYVVPTADASQFVPSASAVDEGQSLQLIGPLNLAVANRIEIAWGDGSPVQVLSDFALGTKSFNIPHVFQDDSNPKNSPSAEDIYQIQVTVVGPGGSATTQLGLLPITVRNLKPSSLNVVTTSTTLNEGGTVGLSVSFVDPGVLDAHKVTIDWGDGTVLTQTLLAGVTNLAQLASNMLSHVYANNPPSGTAGYTLSVEVTDDDEPNSESAAKFSQLITVNNVIPSAVAFDLSAAAINEAGSVTITGGLLVDPGQADTHSVFIDWGDGSAVVSGSLAAGVTDLSSLPVDQRTHVYANDPGGTTPSYTVSVKVADSDERTQYGETLTAVTVNNVAPVLSNVKLNKAGPINEGDSVQVTGTFTDVGQLDRHQVSVTWGDGTTSAATVTIVPKSAPIAYTFVADHTFGDNFNPANILVSVADGRFVQGLPVPGMVVPDDFVPDGGIAQTALSITVLNVAPKAFIAPTLTSTPTQTILDAQVTDPGFRDTFSYVWSINGVVVQNNGDPAAKNLLLDTTTFTSPPRISVVITDDDGGVGAFEVLAIFGTDAAETIVITNSGSSITATSTSITIDNGIATLHSNSVTATAFSPYVLVMGFGGEDLLDASDLSVEYSAILDGGADKDYLKGGAGPSVFFAHNGDDTVEGGKSRDIYKLTPNSTLTVIDHSPDNTLDFSLANFSDGTGLTFDLSKISTTTLVPQTVSTSGGKQHIVQAEGNFSQLVGSNFGDTLIAASNATVSGGGGKDILKVATGATDATLRGGADDDVFSVDALTSVSNINFGGDDGVDTLINLGTIDGLTFSGGADDDVFSNAWGGVISGLNFGGDDGADVFTNLGSITAMTFSGGADDDVFSNTFGGVITGLNFGGDDGADVFTNLGTVTNMTFSGGADDDLFTNATGATISGLNFGGDDGADIFKNFGAASDLTFTGGADDDVFTNEPNATIAGLNFGGDDGADTFTNFGDVTGSLVFSGGADDDVFTNVGTIASVTFGGGADDDVFTNAPDATITGLNFGGDDGADTLTNYGILSGNLVFNGGADDDVFTNLGTVSAMTFNGGADDDVFTNAPSATISGLNFGGDDGADIFKNFGTATDLTFSGGADDDVFTNATGATITGLNFGGDDGADSLTNFGILADNLVFTGGADDDVFTNAPGGTVGGLSFSGDDGADIFRNFGIITALTFSGGADDDVFTNATDATITGLNFGGDDGADTLTNFGILNGGLVFNGDDGADVFTNIGTVSTMTFNGGADDDVFTNAAGATVGGLSFEGGDLCAVSHLRIWERRAVLMLKAVPRAYSRATKVKLPSLESYERQAADGRISLFCCCRLLSPTTCSR